MTKTEIDLMAEIAMIEINHKIEKKAEYSMKAINVLHAVRMSTKELLSLNKDEPFAFIHAISIANCLVAELRSIINPHKDHPLAGVIHGPIMDDDMYKVRQVNPELIRGQWKKLL